MRRLEFAVWGLRGDNGLVAEVRELRRELQAWREEERARHDKESADKITGNRAIILALLAALIASIGTIATLIVGLSG